MIRSFNFGFFEGNLSITQKQGVITCIPKEGKDKRFIKNWRPISLLNVSYKIVSACISNRIKNYLQKLIHPDQKGFMQGRFIGENVRLVYDILAYTENEHKPGLLMLVDFEKAFDSISWDFIHTVLTFLNFGPDIRQWIKVFYTDISSCLNINGIYSSFFIIQRGVRQGDPLSPYLYLLCAEVLSNMLRENELVKGVKIKDEEFLLSQFADDTALCLDGSEESFNEAVRMLSIFAEISGLKINFEKTQVIWIGSCKNCNIRYLRDKNFLWDPGIFRYLGVNFSLNISIIPDLNFDNKLNEIACILKKWQKRQLTPFGKITVIKTLAMSKITFLLSCLPDPTNNFIKEIEKMFFAFLWNDKPNKISKFVMMKSYDKGGLKMLCIDTFLLSLKLSWIRRLSSNSSFCSLTFSMYPELQNLYKLGPMSCIDVKRNIKNYFWKDVMHHLQKLYHMYRPKDVDDFVSECIFFNNKICVGGTFVFYRHWLNQGIYQIYHLLNDDGVFLSFHDFQQKYTNLCTNFLEYQGIVNAIRLYAANLGIIITDEYQQVQPKIIRCILGGKNQISLFLESIATDLKPAGFVKWNTQFNDNLNWPKILYLCHKTTTECKLKWFQLRLLHRILPTKRFLYLRSISQDNLCSFCNEQEESIGHLFWSCKHVNTFWSDLQNLLLRSCPHIINLRLDQELVLFGTRENMFTDKVFDLIILVAKYYIYSLKWTNSIPNIRAFHTILKNRYKLEKYSSLYTNQSHTFDTLWYPYSNLVH